MTKINISGVIGGFEVPGLQPAVDVGGVPPRERLPEHLKKFGRVRGTIASAPLDLAKRFVRFTDQLKGQGWIVGAESVVTDFGFIPIPKNQDFELLLWRPTPFDTDDMEEAVKRALYEVNLGYSKVDAWVGEVVREVIVPTIKDVGKTAKAGAPWVLAGLGIAALLLLTRR